MDGWLSAEGVGDLPSEELSWENLARPAKGGNPTPLEQLAERVVEAEAEGGAGPAEGVTVDFAGDRNPTEMPLEEEVQSVQGTPTGVLCEQVVPILRYLDSKGRNTGGPAREYLT